MSARDRTCGGCPDFTPPKKTDNPHGSPFTIGRCESIDGDTAFGMCACGARLREITANEINADLLEALKEIIPWVMGRDGSKHGDDMKALRNKAKNAIKKAEGCDE